MEKYVKFGYEAKPYIAVIIQQFITAGMVIISKFALNHGLNQHVLVVYRYFVATVIVAPFAFLLERPTLDQNLYYTGMKYTTAIFASAMTNMTPALVFFMAWIVRLEKVNIRQWQSQGKILGTVAAVGGAMVISLIRGPELHLPWTASSHHSSSMAANQQVSLKGAAMVASASVCWAAFSVLQAITIKSYPATLSLTVLICFTGAVQATVIALAMESHNPEAWSLHLDSTLLAPLYSGIMSSGVSYSIQAVVMKTKGPVFATTFNPLSMVIVAIISSFILSEILYLGRVIGAAVIVTGLYLVLWGKSKDQPAFNSASEKLAPSDKLMTPITERPDTSEEERVAVDVPRIRTVDDSV